MIFHSHLDRQRMKARHFFHFIPSGVSQNMEEKITESSHTHTHVMLSDLLYFLRAVSVSKNLKRCKPGQKKRHQICHKVWGIWSSAVRTKVGGTWPHMYFPPIQCPTSTCSKPSNNASALVKNWSLGLLKKCSGIQNAQKGPQTRSDPRYFGNDQTQMSQGINHWYSESKVLSKLIANQGFRT